MAKRIAQQMAKGDPDIAEEDAVVVVLIYGYDMGGRFGVEEARIFVQAGRAAVGREQSEARSMGLNCIRPLIGQLQALVNNPSRTRDVDDIRALLRAQRGKLNMTEVREYFALFESTGLRDELLAQIADEAS